MSSKSISEEEEEEGSPGFDLLINSKCLPSLGATPAAPQQRPDINYAQISLQQRPSIWPSSMAVFHYVLPMI